MNAGSGGGGAGGKQPAPHHRCSRSALVLAVTPGGVDDRGGATGQCGNVFDSQSGSAGCSAAAADTASADTTAPDTGGASAAIEFEWEWEWDFVLDGACGDAMDAVSTVAPVVSTGGGLVLSQLLLSEF